MLTCLCMYTVAQKTKWPKQLSTEKNTKNFDKSWSLGPPVKIQYIVEFRDL